MLRSLKRFVAINNTHNDPFRADHLSQQANPEPAAGYRVQHILLEIRPGSTKQPPRLPSTYSPPPSFQVPA